MLKKRASDPSASLRGIDYHVLQDGDPGAECGGNRVEKTHHPNGSAVFFREEELSELRVGEDRSQTRFLERGIWCEFLLL